MTPHTPGSTPTATVEAAVAYVWALLGHRYRAMQEVGLAPRLDDPFPGMMLSPLATEVRLAERPEAPPEATAAALLAHAEVRLDAARAALDAALSERPAPPLAILRRRLDLNDPEWIAVLVALAAELDPGLAATLAWLQGHYEKRLPTPALIADLIGAEALRLRIRDLFEADAPLISRRTLTLDTTRPFDPLLHRLFRLDPRLVAFVTRGDTAVAPSLAPFVTSVDPSAVPDDLVVTQAEQPAWDRFRAFASQHPSAFTRVGPVLLLRGEQGAGRRRWAVELARVAELPVLLCDLAELARRRAPKDVDTTIAEVVREARLHGAILVLSGWEELVDPVLRVGAPEDASPELLRARRHAELVALFDTLLADHPLLVVLALPEAGATPQPLPEFARGLELFDVPAPSPNARRRLWSRALTPGMKAAGIDPRGLALRFQLTPGRILDAVTGAAEAVRREGREEVRDEDIGAAIRQQVQVRMGGIATLRRSTETWDDLVTSPEIEIQLRELCHRYRFRDKVMDGWGLRRRFGSAFGLSALFEGPPGTGKTMSAGLVAAELGLDLYQVDLSQIVSKWIGETEKNLSKVFDEAERSGAMLLFDEADSLFSKRTSVSSANDRYANLEVNYLLQRIERFTGVAVLTTNFADSIDSAFARRLSMRITFASPGIPERERLWASMLAEPGLPLGDFDALALAEDFDFAGGLIRNAVLRAAFFAASRNILITQELLVLSARIEMKEKGLLIRGNPHVELIELLTNRRG